jgi:hypothetical protein
MVPVWELSYVELLRNTVYQKRKTVTGVNNYARVDTYGSNEGDALAVLLPVVWG